MNQAPSQWLPNFKQILGINLPMGGLPFITGNVIPFAVGLLLFLIIIASLFFLILGGIRWIMSRGDKEGLTKARDTIVYALIGLILGFCSIIIMGLLGRLLGVDLVGTGPS